MTVRNLKIDAVTGDLVLAKGNLVLVGQAPSGAGSDLDAIAQAVNAEIRMVAGEWFLDDLQNPRGVPYFGAVLGKGATAAMLKKVFTDAILRVQGVKSVPQLDIRYVPGTRNVTIAWSVVGAAGLLVKGQTGSA